VPGGRQADVSACPREQLGSELPFELADLAAKHGLGDIETLCSPSEVEFLGDGCEVPKLPQVQRGAGLQTHAVRVSPAPEEVLRTAMRGAIVVAFPTKGVLMSATPAALTSATPAERPLDNKVVLVIGGAKNLGGHVSRDLAIQGARVAVHYNSDATAAAAEETVGVVTDAGTDAFAIQADLSDVAQVERTFDAVVTGSDRSTPPSTPPAWRWAGMWSSSRRRSTTP
jgi:hypothetical protein